MGVLHPSGDTATEEEDNSVEILKEAMVEMDVNSSDSEEIVQMDVLEAGDVTATAPDNKKLRLSKEMEVCGVIRRLQEEVRGLASLLALGRLQGDQRSSLDEVREQISHLLGQE